MHGALMLVRVATFLRTGEGLTPGDADQFYASVEKYIAGASLEEAMGLQLLQGENHPSYVLRLQRRDGHIGSAGRMLNDPSDYAKAKKLEQKWLRYHGSGWKNERTEPSCPPHRVGTIEGHFWEALYLHDSVLTYKSIQKILSNQRK
jgi:hypothetical protein